MRRQNRRNYGNSYSNLTGFTGTQNYHKDFMNLNVTDGVKYFQTTSKADWLISDAAVIFKMKLHNPDFAVLNVDIKNHHAIATYEDGNGKKLFTQEYRYTDLKDGKLKFYYQNGVMMLPTEY